MKEETVTTFAQMNAEIAPISPAFHRAPSLVRTSASELINVLVATLRLRGVKMRTAKSLITDEYIRQEILQAGGNHCKAARNLGIHRNTLSRMKEGH